MLRFFVRRWPRITATFRAVPYLVPITLPPLTPLKRPPTGRAYLGWEFTFLAVNSWFFCIFHASSKPFFSRTFCCIMYSREKIPISLFSLTPQQQQKGT